MTSFFDTSSRSIFGARAPKQAPQDPQLHAMAQGDIALMARLVQDAKQASRPHRCPERVGNARGRRPLASPERCCMACKKGLPFGRPFVLRDMAQ